MVLISIAYSFGRGPAETRSLRDRMQGAQTPHLTRSTDLSEVADLPAPVRIYFHGALRPSQPMIGLVRFDQVGDVNWGAMSPHWRNFIAEYVVTTQRPGYDWNARIWWAPGLAFRAHNAFVAGLKTLHMTPFGLFTLSLDHTPEKIHFGLMRFLVEAPWYPTALLPSQGVHWRAVDDTSAMAVLTEGRTSVAALFTFGANGMIESVRTLPRTEVPNEPVWEARYANYENESGVRIPLDCTIGWWAGGALQPFWQAHVTTAVFEFWP